MRSEAERYCVLIEGAETSSRETFAADVAASLANVVTAAYEMPEVEPTDTELPDGPTDEQWRATSTAVQATLGDWTEYWTTLEASGGHAADAVCLTLGDDLADIWRDLERGLIALRDGADPDDVTWEWRFGFYSHWGRHATNALRALHARLADNGGPPRRGSSK